jgi:hypothetical protein
MKPEIPEDVRKLLKEVVDHFDKEDVAIRERQLRTWRRLKLMWEGFQRAWYSEVAHDWRIWDFDNESSDTDQSYYDKPINVFRAYLESIIAALSVTVPPVKCYPDDADNNLDLSTAKAGDKIAQLIYRHNNVPLLWVHALFIYCTEGMVACYSYPKSDEKYGTYEEKKYKSEEEGHQYTKCPNCGFIIDDQMMDPAMMAQTNPEAAMQLDMLGQKATQAEDEYMPDDTDVAVQDAVQNATAELCPNCLQLIAPELSQETLIVERLVGITNKPKSRMCLEAYGGLYVKVPNYARRQEDCPYLIYEYETHYANVIERYASLHGQLNPQKVKASAGAVRDPYAEWARLNPQYQGEYPQNVVTVRNAWLRPAAFNVLAEQEDIDELKKRFPNGCKVIFANDCFADAENESLDDCWTITHNPLSDYIHSDPIGLLLVSIQEITNDLISLILQTIEHGIGQTFADPGVLNFNAYRQMESTPGGIYEATPKSGKSVGDAFHEVKTATLSAEVMPFAQNIQSLAQLVSGALPSLFGGSLEGSETASQYSMSRAQALQRLQNTWKIFTTWWKEIFGKTIPMFIKETRYDERDVQRDKDGNFINIFIRKAELEGKLGKVELEANENLPITWSQQKDVIMQLLQASNPQILAILAAPENLPIIRDAIGLTDFIVPGEKDRNKQYDEIKLLLNSEPIVMPPDPMMVMQGAPPEPMEMPSIEVEPDFDDHQIQYDICREWIIGEAGRQAKVENEAGYKNVLLHAKMHLQFVQMAQMQEQQAAQESGEEGSEVTEQDQEAPIMGEENVATVQ